MLTRHSINPASFNGRTFTTVTTHSASLEFDFTDCSDERFDLSKDAKVRNNINNAALVMSAPGMVMIRLYGALSLSGMSEPNASMIGPKLAQAGNEAFIRFDIMGFPRTLFAPLKNSRPPTPMHAIALWHPMLDVPSRVAVTTSSYWPHNGLFILSFEHIMNRAERSCSWRVASHVTPWVGQRLC